VNLGATVNTAFGEVQPPYRPGWPHAVFHVGQARWFGLARPLRHDPSAARRG
jgi:hypothetical protein